MYSSIPMPQSPGETDRDAVLRALAKPGFAFEWMDGELHIRQDVVDEEDSDDVGLSVEVQLMFEPNGSLCSITTVLNGYDDAKWKDVDTP